MKTGYCKIGFIAAAIGLSIGSAVAMACPFCDAPTQTLSEETAAADAVVLAKLIKEAPTSSDPNDPNVGAATFQIVDVLRGKEILGDAKEIEAVYFGEPDKERVFLITGLNAEALDWTTPLALSDAAVDYIRKLPGLPASGADRLAFFQEYLQNDDPLLAQDAYDEFARAPYEEVIALGPRMHHDKLVEWIADLEINPSRRRLYLTMLGVCGSKDDLPLLESMIVSDFSKMEPALKEIVAVGMAMQGPYCLPGWMEVVEQRERQKKLGLDALVACYLVLRGPDGLDLIDQRFLKDPSIDYTHIYSTIMALRFHGDQDTGVIPKERLLQSMRLLLDNPDFADQVILDLSRWEDWSVLDRLVTMFKQADERSYVRQPVITYLTVAAEQPGDVGSKAGSALKELEELDPKTVKQARSLMAFGALSRARASGASGSDAAADKKKADAAADTQAFAAGAADQETEPTEFADPAGYEEIKDGADDGQSTANASEVASEAGRTDNASEKPEAVSNATVKDESKVSAADAMAPASAPTADAAAADTPTPTPSSALIVGVPLLAAGVLMGVYWLILRAGAV